MLGIPLTTFAYLLANVGFFAVLSKAEVMASHAVAVVSEGFYFVLKLDLNTKTCIVYTFYGYD